LGRGGPAGLPGLQGGRTGVGGVGSGGSGRGSGVGNFGGKAKVAGLSDKLIDEKTRGKDGLRRGGKNDRGGNRPNLEPPQGTTLTFTVGLARHSGDWDSSPTALYNLASSFKERCGLPDVNAKVINCVPLNDGAALKKCTLLLLTSNNPIAFTDAEIAGLRVYVEGGGTLWINDSGASGDERFDTALRADLKRLFPGKELERLDTSHLVFNSAYDLRNGYKGYKIPPGDKYRAEYLEGIQFSTKTGIARAGVIYTRNDYADGLEIDPRAIAGRMSLTDLTAEEMLEGSLRFGINLLGYALGSKAPVMPPPPESVAQFQKIYRYSGPDLPVVDDFESNTTAENIPVWVVEDFSNPAHLTTVKEGEGQALKVTFQGGDKMKAAIGRIFEVDLSSAKSVIFDLHLTVSHGYNVAMLFQTKGDWTGYESRPVFIRPGWNRNLRFPLDLDDFKSSKTEWKSYDTAFKPRENIGKVVIMLYNMNDAGEARIDSLRIEK
jgi:hypothetical protein